MGIWQIIKGEQPGLLQSWLHYKNKGQFAEYTIAFALTNGNLRGKMLVLRNLYLPVKNGTTEIDVLMIHEKGIYVFESKNYSGYISGAADHAYWTQSFENGEEYNFYNPIWQNRTHINALATCLHRSVSEFTSYIVFSDRCTPSNVPQGGDEFVIVQQSELLKSIRKRMKHMPIKYTRREIKNMAEQLTVYTNRSEWEKRQHIKNIIESHPDSDY